MIRIIFALCACASTANAQQPRQPHTPPAMSQADYTASQAATAQLQQQVSTTNAALTAIKTTTAAQVTVR